MKIVSVNIPYDQDYLSPSQVAFIEKHSIDELKVAPEEIPEAQRKDDGPTVRYPVTYNERNMQLAVNSLEDLLPLVPFTVTKVRTIT